MYQSLSSTLLSVYICIRIPTRLLSSLFLIRLLLTIYSHATTKARGDDAHERRLNKKRCFSQLCRTKRKETAEERTVVRCGV